MTSVAEVALWLSLLGLGGVAGVRLVVRAPSREAPAGTDLVQLGACALLVVAWAAIAGALIRADASLAIVVEGVPVDAPVFARLATLWSTWRGALLTSAAVVALSGLALARRPLTASTATNAGRALDAALAVLALALLVVSLVAGYPLATAAEAVVPAAVPVYLLHDAAALTSLLALAALLSAALAVVMLVTVRGGPTPSSGRLESRLLSIAWLCATLALAAEQVARTRVGLTTRDAVALGSSSSVLVLWVILSVLVHERTVPWIARYLGSAARSVSAPAVRARWLRHVAHVGAALVVLSFAAHAVARRADLVLTSGQSAESADAFGKTWRFTNQGLSRFDASGTDVVALALDARTAGGATRLLTTERRQRYGRTGDPLGAAIGYRAIWPGVLQEVRLVLTDVEPGTGDTARVRVSFVPLAWAWQAGILLLVLSGAASLLMRPAARTALSSEA